MTQTTEPLQTVEPGKVRMYVCGPTVYSNSHIGHMVGPVIFDTLKRFLVYNGYEVRWVVNITDIDDKLIVQALKDGTTVSSLAVQVTDDYLNCLKALGVDGIDEMPRATEYVPQIITMTQTLIDKGCAYPSQGDVYFDVTQFPEYGKLSHRDPEELQAGARIEPTSIKKHPGDFALWKGSKPGEPYWDSPWGPGRPGWHIECSAMSMSLLGEQIDIHGGGLDLVFPHHENEVAQSEACTHKPFVRYWLHNGLLTKDGKKIAKSDPETVVLMKDLLTKHDTDTLRSVFLTSHYRRPIDYGPTRLDELSRGLQAFHGFFDRYQSITGELFHNLEAPTQRADLDPTIVAQSTLVATLAEHRNNVLSALDDDFNTGGAFGELYEMVRALNRFIDTEKLENASERDPAKVNELRQGAILLRELTRIFGLFREPLAKAQVDDALVAPLVDFLIELRAKLRKEKQFQLADSIRTKLAELHVTLEDRPDGTRWKIERH